MKLVKWGFFISLIFLLYFPIQVNASSFNPNFILSDAELFDSDQMSSEDIYSFLKLQGSRLAELRFKDVDGVEKWAAEIIDNAARKYGISQKYLLVLLQKEQGLIENSSPTSKQLDWAAGYGVCDGCHFSLIQKFKGFVNQVDRAAWRNNYYYENATEGGFIQAGVETVIDGVPVTPINQATANLYNYTPHFHGNQILWKLWHRYFIKSYPDGTLLQADNEQGVWIIQRSKRRPFESRAALVSRYDPRMIVTVTKEELSRYEIGRAIKFPQYSLLRSPGGTVYLLVDDFRRGITSREVFRSIGFNPEEIVDLTWEELDAFPEGPSITMASAHPTGALLQNEKNGAVFYIENGTKHPVQAREILNTRFRHRPITVVTANKLEEFPEGEPVKFRDGTLVTSPLSAGVFVISGGDKHLIASSEIFNTLGYNWNNIIWTDDFVLNAYPQGQTIDLSDLDTELATE